MVHHHSTSRPRRRSTVIRVGSGRIGRRRDGEAEDSIGPIQGLVIDGIVPTGGGCGRGIGTRSMGTVMVVRSRVVGGVLLLQKLTPDRLKGRTKVRPLPWQGGIQPQDDSVVVVVVVVAWIWWQDWHVRGACCGCWCGGGGTRAVSDPMRCQGHSPQGSRHLDRPGGNMDRRQCPVVIRVVVVVGRTFLFGCLLIQCSLW